MNNVLKDKSGNILNPKIPRYERDYIVEEGTTGIWTYRKWKSGIAECWGIQTFAIKNWAAWGNVYGCDKVVGANFPFTFISIPMTFMYILDSGTNNILSLGFASGSSSNSKAPDFSFYRPTAGVNVNSAKISIHAIGKWK